MERDELSTQPIPEEEEEQQNQQERKIVPTKPLSMREKQLGSLTSSFDWVVLVMLLIIILAWSTPNVIGRYLAVKSALTPLQISVLRYFPAALTLFLYSFCTKRAQLLFATLQKQWFHLLITSIILSSFVSLQMYSVTLTTASASSFLLNINPIVTFLLSIFILKERHRWWGGLGVVIAAVGIFFIAIPLENFTFLIAPELLLGNLLAFLSGVMWAVYTIYLKRFLKNSDPLLITTWTLFFSSLFLMVAMFALDGWFNPPPRYYHILLTIFLGIVPTAVAFTLWFETVRRIPVQKASAFQFLIPVFATLFALAMGETINWFFVLGGGLILCGLLLTQLA